MLMLPPQESISDRLAADENFQSFVTGMHAFTSKIKTNETVNLFQLITEQKATEQQKEEFANGIGMKYYEEVTAELKTVFTYKAGFQKTFEKEIITKDEMKISVSSVLLNRKINPSDCWTIWLAQMAACAFLCNFEYDSPCYYSCFAIASGESGLCFLLAD